MDTISKLYGRVIYFLLLAAVPFLSSSCGGNRNSNYNDTAGGTPVQVTHPVLMNLTDYLTFNGNTVFLNKEIVRATFQGFIQKIYKNIGDPVKAGDIIFQVRTKESAANDSLKLTLGKELFRGSINIRASNGGVLTKLDYHEGDFVTAGEQLAVISNPSSLRIKLNVPFEDNLKVKIGGRCEVNLPDGENINGVIEKEVPSVDPATQTQTYFIKLNTGKELPENLNTIVKIPFAEFKNTTVLPKSSVITNVTEDSFWVMKLANDTTAVRVNIKKGIENDSVVQILSPKLDTTAKIILTGAYGLPDTSKVEIVK